MLNAQQQAMQQAADVSVHFKLLVYSTYAAILICAVFRVLIFWKLCQIKALLQQTAPAYPTWQKDPSAAQASSMVVEPTTPAADDDLRFQPGQ